MKKKQVTFFVPVEIAVKVSLSFDAEDSASDDAIRRAAALEFRKWAHGTHSESTDLELAEDSTDFMERVNASLFEAELDPDQIEKGANEASNEDSKVEEV